MFCPSPWLHMRIDSQGHYHYCRWASGTNALTSIKDMGPIEYFHSQMDFIRTSMLAGKTLPGCAPCHEMERHGKVSGRQRQLIKIGVMPDHWSSSMASSPWLPIFQSSEGSTRELPVDWQIDLGNYCNSACVFCLPRFSSRLASEWQEIGLIDEMPGRSWCETPTLLDRFLSDLVSVPNIKYLHFIGGETLITPAFATILSRLIDHGIADTISLGFTTNLTVWDDRILRLLQQFQQIHVGISVECFDKANDYIRYPSKISQVTKNAERWVTTARDNGWLLQIRTTPTIFSISRLLSVYEFAWQHKITVESCNFLQNPQFMKIDLLSHAHRQPIIDQLSGWNNAHRPRQSSTLVNTRNPETYQIALCQDLDSYCRYLESVPENHTQWPNLIDFVKRLEGRRRNSILDYIPEYESIFRAHGY